MTPDQVREIAENAADKAAEKAVTKMLTALGIDVNNLPEEQQAWAFLRNMHQGTRRGARALFTGFLTALATSIAGTIWLIFFNKPHS